ncbi:DUF1453 family protein [Streptomyces dysideae]|uniref:DUF1453 domain-containing protein n=1 Tax=Streptomyces dysideae TaxID=909626 RepID=A0A101UVI5_9ACTN|nr:DUF1453 family protein [Streptomyces dysideae]KUO17595.1 hypothetical protein AQJ91_29830 [Streptomyces dysideae]
MSGLVDALLIAAAVVVVIARLLRARRMGNDRRWWLVPVGMAVLALREPGVVDAGHRTEALLLLGAELVVGLAMGAAWAWTTRIWVAPDGSVWSKSTRKSLAVWLVGLALRVGLFACGAVLGVRQDTSALLLALAVTLLVRSGILVRRAQSIVQEDGRAAASGRSTAYGDDVPRPARKERV